MIRSVVLRFLRVPAVAVAFTATESWYGLASVDGTAGWTNVATVDPGWQFPTADPVTAVWLQIAWRKVDGTCQAPVAGDARHAETGFRLRAPDGRTLELAAAGTWSGSANSDAVYTAFEDGGPAPSGFPVGGSFGATGGGIGDTFFGASTAGDWTLQAQDTGAGAPLCVIGFVLSLTTDAATPCHDNDGDGFDDIFCGGDDCYDLNPGVHPGADEGCDGFDSDCDGQVGAAEQDTDGDFQTPCFGDCDDGDPAV